LIYKLPNTLNPSSSGVTASRCGDQLALYKVEDKEVGQLYIENHSTNGSMGSATDLHSQGCGFESRR